MISTGIWREYAKSFEYSEEEFSEVESRLNEVNHLKAKYGNTVSDILAYCEEKRQRLSELEDYDSFMQELLEKQKKAEKQMEKAAMELHEVREQNAVKFAEEIVHQMSELNFLDARFEIRLTEAKVILHKEKMMQSFICRLIRENLCVHWGMSHPEESCLVLCLQ